MCHNPANGTTEVPNKQACADAVKRITGEEYPVTNMNHNFYPHGCSFDAATKTANWRSHTWEWSKAWKWRDWSEKYQNGEFKGIIPDNSCRAFDGNCDAPAPTTSDSLSKYNRRPCPPYSDTSDCEGYEALPVSCQSTGKWAKFTCVCAKIEKASVPQVVGASMCSGDSFTCEEACAGASRGDARAVVNSFSTKSACVGDAVNPGKVTARAMCCADGWQEWWKRVDNGLTFRPGPYSDGEGGRRYHWNKVVAARSKMQGQNPYVLGWLPNLAVLIGAPLIVSLVYAIYAFCKVDDLDYLGNVMHNNSTDENHVDIYSYFDAVAKEKPTLIMHIVCYHNETRTTGSGNDRRTQNVTVVTWRGSREIQYLSWYDQSQRPEDLERYPFIKLLSKKAPIAFANAATEQHVSEQRQRFQDENRHCDRSLHDQYK